MKLIKMNILYWEYYSCIFSTTIIIMLINNFQLVNTNSHRHSLAREFTSRMQELTTHWTCNIPKAKLVYVNEEHKTLNTPNAVWIPAVAILHRCEQATGCCSNHPAFTCKHTSSENVSLVFKKINMLTNEREMTYERLSFTNHTACACLPLVGVTNDV